jgi:hypothetical protein
MAPMPGLIAQLPLLAISLGVTLVAIVVGVLIHELGHIVAGYATGLRVARVNLGPLEIRDFGRPRVRLVPSLQAGVVLVPYESASSLGPLRWSLLISTAAGPIAGLAFGGALIALAGGLHLRGPSHLEMVGQMSVILGLLNLLPLRTGDALADGRRIFALLLRTRESGHILVATLMLAEALSGRRPREWDAALVAAMERSPDEPFARLCLYEAAMDRGEIEVAGRHLDAAVDLRKENWTAADAVLFAEAAYYVARHRGDARAGRAWLGVADGWTLVDYLRARAEAAVLCAEGRGDVCATAAAARSQRQRCRGRFRVAPSPLAET